MKTLFLEKSFEYSGKELRSLFLYENDLKGNGILSWEGSCDVKVDSMVDMEDKINNDHIYSESMLHFLGEFFHKDIFYGIFVQRLFGEHSKSLLKEMSGKEFVRQGDDLYFENKKLNVSIATVSPVSSLVHFAINISSENTPVETIGLKDLGVDSKEFALKLLNNMKKELISIEEASYKVKTV